MHKFLPPLLIGLLAAFAGLAFAATTNYSVAVPGVVLLPIHLPGQYTADEASTAAYKLPFAATVVGVSATCRASGGTTPTLGIDINEDGTTILSADISVTAGAVAEGTLADTALADEATITVDFDVGGTNPTWDDCDVLLTMVRI